MTKRTKPVAPKPVEPEPVLAWCALYNGKIAAGWCCWDRETASRWADSVPGGKLIRVEIRPAPARRKGGRK